MTTRTKPGQERHKCGCISDARHWLMLCAPHKAEFDVTHQRWAADLAERRRQQEQQE
jgi:hypothetical protein